VTITTKDLDSPMLRYDCVPSKNPNDVFLTAAAKNQTEYPVLAGTAAIFVDNCFTSKVCNRFSKLGIPKEQ
jgi:hypothetical protein